MYYVCTPMCYVNINDIYDQHVERWIGWFYNTARCRGTQIFYALYLNAEYILKYFTLDASIIYSDYKIFIAINYTTIICNIF